MWIDLQALQRQYRRRAFAGLVLTLTVGIVLVLVVVYTIARWP